MDAYRKITVNVSQPASYRYDKKLPAESAMLEELLKASEIQQLFESYYSLIHIPVAIIDLNANVLVSSRWQRICTQFHRLHPRTCAHCVESDKMISSQIKEGETYAVCACPNGLTDCASPIIIEGKHIANVFIGQFLTQKPDEARFLRQAKKFGFDDTDYIAALREVPVVDEKDIPKILDLLTGMTRVITNLSVDRKRAVAEQARQSIILNAIPQAVFWKDHDGRYLGCNAPFADDAGLASPSDIVGKTDFELPWSRQEAEAYRADDQAVISSNRPRLHIIESLSKADGSRIDIDTSKIPLTNADRNPYGIVGIYEDITEPKRVQEALRESERMHQTLLDCMPCVALLIRHKSREIVAMNKAAARAGATLGKTCFGSWAKCDKPCSFCLAPETWASGENQEKVFEALGVVWEAHWMPVSEDLYLHYAFDITDRMHAEEAIRESDEKFRLAFTTGLDAFYWSTLEEGRMIEVNPVFENMTGYSRDEVIGKTSLQLGLYCNPDDRAIMVSELKAKGQIKDFELEARKKNGEKFTISISVSKVTLKNQLYILGVVKDITANKQAEREQRKIQSQLQQAQKMESVGRLAGGVAHDFNNMLGVIIGHAELALSQLDPAQPLYEDLTEIRMAADRSANLTRQLLAFARKQTVAPKILDLNETVAEMLNMLQRLIGEDINLKWHPGAILWPVKIDPSQIDQILANLVVNSRDAITGVGKIAIETKNCTLDEDYCSAHSGGVPGDYIMLALSDDGGGMDKDTMAKIFEPFFTTKGIGKGTGLGLSTVYGIVNQNNGFINVYSEPGHGSTFTIYLPRHIEKSELMAATVGVAQPARRGQETILLVEDEPSLLKLTQKMLETQGYAVLSASTPGEAIRLANERNGEIHLLLTDMVMPKMNGRDLANNLESIYPHIKRLFMSGYTADIIEENGVLDEGVHFIQKPFSVQSLGIKLRDVLESV